MDVLSRRKHSRKWNNYKSLGKVDRVLHCYPDEFITSYSSYDLNNMTQWVTCRFSCNAGDEHVIALGDEEGYITVADVRNAGSTDEFMSESRVFRADTSVIMDCQFIPGAPNRLITASGSKEVRIWDLETQNSINCVGHELSVRAVSVSPDNPNVFLTGARDGTLMVWDIRESLQKLTQSRHSSTIVTVDCSHFRQYTTAHFSPTGIEQERLKQKRARLTASGTKQSTALRKLAVGARKLPTITAVLFASDKYFVSASSSSLSGIRVWDTRYQQCMKPVRTFEVPKRADKDCGMTSLCWDRFQSRFYATCTDNCVYEYELWHTSIMPMRTFVGAKIDSFYIPCATSPLSDHLACGSSDGCTLIWDLQERHRYANDGGFETIMPTSYLPFPKFKINGHKSDVCVVTWSPNGRYLLTMDVDQLRVWDSTGDWFRRKSEATEYERVIDGVPRKIDRPQLLEPPTRESIQEELRAQANIAHEYYAPIREKLDDATTLLDSSGSILADVGNRAISTPNRQRSKPGDDLNSSQKRKAITVQRSLPASFFVTSSGSTTESSRKRKIKDEPTSP